MATLGAGSRCQESTIITFEWDLMGLKEIFESSRDDEKSPLIASAPFGGGRWQLHFYASAARAASCSLYIAAIPTADELRLGAQACLSQGGWPREGAHWSRRGPFKFTFEIKSLDGTIPIVARGPHEPMIRKEFNYSVSTWGYPQYVRRTEIYGDRAIAKANNGVKIICTMTYPLAPVFPANPDYKSRTVSNEVIDSLANIFDDPSHSDVVFKFPTRGGGVKKPTRYRSIYANKKILARRSDYFRSLFEGGFAESRPCLWGRPLAGSRPKELGTGFLSAGLDLSLSDEDSDAESDYDADESPMEIEEEACNSDGRTSPTLCSQMDSMDELCVIQALDGNIPMTPERQLRAMTPESIPSDTEDEFPESALNPCHTNTSGTESTLLFPSMQTIVVKDAAYLTYRALLFALYTDQLNFAPLSSTYHNDRALAIKNDLDFPYNTRREYVRSRISSPRTDTERKAPFPCSPKSLYKLADQLGIQRIKDQSFAALKDSFNPRNIATELFGSFSSLFPEVRRVETEYLLTHWDDVSHSDAMMYDMNPFNHTSRSTSILNSRANARTCVANQELFIFLLHALRPKSRREQYCSPFGMMSSGGFPMAMGGLRGPPGEDETLDARIAPLVGARNDFAAE